MKRCILCKEQYFQNHNCKEKKGVFPNPKQNYPEAMVVPYSSKTLNPESISKLLEEPKPKAPSNDFYQTTNSRTLPNPSPKPLPKPIPNPKLDSLPTDQKLLHSVFTFLSSFHIYTRFIISHNCEDTCLACISKEYFKVENPDSLSFAQSYINSFYDTEVELLDFVNCLTVVLNIFHTLYLRSQSGRDICQFMCISHKIFGYSLFRTITCVCGAKSEKSITPSHCTLHFTVTLDFRCSKQKLLSYKHPSKLMHCPRGCTQKSSEVSLNVFKYGDYLMVKLKYEEEFSAEVFEKLLRFNDGEGILDLTFFVTNQKMSTAVLDVDKNVWKFDYFELSKKQLIDRLVEQKNYPIVLVYGS